jgi:hypothetical protein
MSERPRLPQISAAEHGQMIHEYWSRDPEIDGNGWTGKARISTWLLIRFPTANLKI